MDTHDITDNSESPDCPSIYFKLEQPLNSGHPATPYIGQFSRSQLYASNTQRPQLADTHCPVYHRFCSLQLDIKLVLLLVVLASA